MAKQLTTNHGDQIISKSWRNNLLQIMAIKLSQSHDETTYYKSLRSSYLKVMAKQLTTNHGDQVILKSWRNNLLQIMAI